MTNSIAQLNRELIAELLAKKRLLVQDLQEALDALREIVDWQYVAPTPPLERYEKAWSEAMAKAEAVLKKHGA